VPSHANDALTPSFFLLPVCDDYRLYAHSVVFCCLEHRLSALLRCRCYACVAFNAFSALFCFLCCCMLPFMDRRTLLLVNCGIFLPGCACSTFLLCIAPVGVFHFLPALAHYTPAVCLPSCCLHAVPGPPLHTCLFVTLLNTGTAGRGAATARYWPHRLVYPFTAVHLLYRLLPASCSTVPLFDAVLPGIIVFCCLHAFYRYYRLPPPCAYPIPFAGVRTAAADILAPCSSLSRFFCRLSVDYSAVLRSDVAENERVMGRSVGFLQRFFSSNRGSTLPIHFSSW